MTIIAYHQGCLYADDKVQAAAGYTNVFLSADKIVVSRCKRFAFASAGTLYEGSRRIYMEDFLLKHLVDFYQDKNLMIPAGISQVEELKMLTDSMLLMTHEHAWFIFRDDKTNKVNLVPAMGAQPVCMGTGADTLLALWALEWEIPKAMKRISFYVPTCSEKIKVVKATNLKPFKFVENK